MKVVSAVVLGAIVSAAHPAKADTSTPVDLSFEIQGAVSQHLSGRVETRDFMTSSLRGSSSQGMIHVCGLILVNRGPMLADEPVPFYVAFSERLPDVGAALVARPRIQEQVRETCAENGDLLRADWTSDGATKEDGWLSWLPGM